MVGAVVEGVVTGITHFGAFVSLPGGKTGLVHISEVADAYVRDVHDYLKENDTVKVKILSYDGQQKVALSIRQAQPRPAGEAASAPPRRISSGGGRPFGRGGGRGPGRATFEDRLAHFMKEADERQSDLKKHHDAKRGHRGGRGHGEGII